MKNAKTFFTWIAMWLADLVPWVSWGTIAFMSGLYEELIWSLSSFTLWSFNDLFSGRFKKFWKTINGNFLVALFWWVAVSILVWSRWLHWLMESYPTYLSVFFVWLIVCSAFFLYRDIDSNLGKSRNIAYAWLWVLFWLLVTAWSWFSIPLTWPGYIIAWILWSLAMLLPWISWSYILLIVWMYEPIIKAVSYFSEALTTWNTQLLFQMLPVIISVWLWVIIGIVLMSKVLKRLLAKRHTQTILILLWVMIGALPAITPTWWVISTTLLWSAISFIVWCVVVATFFIVKK